MASRSPSVTIIGAGFGGIGMAVRLMRAGIEDVTILERADRVGGVWAANRYPGAACDIPASLYSFSFAPKADWSRRYPPQPEIRDAGRRGALRGAAPGPLRRRGRRGAVRRRPRPLGARPRRRRHARNRGAGDGVRSASRPAVPPCRVSRTSPARRSTRPPAARPRPDRTARGGGRHRRDAISRATSSRGGAHDGRPARRPARHPETRPPVQRSTADGFRRCPVCSG